VDRDGSYKGVGRLRGIFVIVGPEFTQYAAR